MWNVRICKIASRRFNWWKRLSIISMMKQGIHMVISLFNVFVGWQAIDVGHILDLLLWQRCLIVIKIFRLHFRINLFKFYLLKKLNTYLKRLFSQTGASIPHLNLLVFSFSFLEDISSLTITSSHLNAGSSFLCYTCLIVVNILLLSFPS